MENLFQLCAGILDKGLHNWKYVHSVPVKPQLCEAFKNKGMSKWKCVWLFLVNMSCARGLEIKGSGNVFICFCLISAV